MEKLYKISATFLIDGTKNSTRSFDKGLAATTGDVRGFINSYKELLQTGTTIVRGSYISYEKTEVNF